jgi:hypothetical protein
MEIQVKRNNSLTHMKDGLLVSDLFFNLYSHMYKSNDKKNIEYLALMFARSLYDMGYNIKTRDLIDDFNHRI